MIYVLERAIISENSRGSSIFVRGDFSFEEDTSGSYWRMIVVGIEILPISGVEINVSCILEELRETSYIGSANLSL
ncbi:MAG: hypothetical protein KPI85_03095 [cyanobacterium endosymbiont of Epithemia adnata isolate EadnSB Bon19]